MKKRNKIFFLLTIATLLIFSTLSFNSCGILCNHAEGDWIVDAEADYHNDGARHTECQKCGKTVRTETIPQLVCKHEVYEWIVDKEASKTEAGARRQVCKNCHDTLAEEEISKINLNADEVRELVEKSIVKVLCYDYSGRNCISQGSGFFIDSSGTFITNAHVVKDVCYVKIKMHSGEIFDATIMYAYDGTTSDYAILKADDCASQPLVFEEKFGTGDVVYAFGYPNDAHILQSAEGKVLRTHIKSGEIKYFENDAAINHGSSGGALLNSDGKVIGLTTGQLSNLNYAAVAYRDIKDVINSKYTSGKPTLEWFFDEVTVDFTAQNFEDYFDLKIDAKVTLQAEVKYTLNLKLKPEFANRDFELKSEKVKITVLIKTVYLTKAGVEIATTNESAEFLFDSKEDLISGKEKNLTTSATLSGVTSATVSYELTYSDVSGSLTFTE